MDEIKNENVSSEAGSEQKEAIHASLLERDHLEYLFGDAVAKSLIQGHPIGGTARTTKHWLRKLVRREPEEARADLLQRIEALWWNQKEHELRCYRLFHEAVDRRYPPDRIAALQRAIDRLKELPQKEAPKPRKPQPGDADREWLTEERIAVMIRLSPYLGDTYSALEARIMTAFRTNLERREVLIQHLDEACAVRRRLIDMPAKPEPIPAAPAPEAPQASKEPSSDRSARFRDRYGDKSRLSSALH